jgi:type IV fimbrial biogenesis protein FimT
MKNRARGFTLIELMTAILVLAILVGVAIPSFREFASDSRMGSAASDLVTAMNVARSEALRRSTPVEVCASADLAGCANTTNWTSGWIVFADFNGNGAVDANELLQSWAGPQAGVTVTADVTNAIYNAMGMAQIPGGAATATFTTTHPACSGNRARQSVLRLTGSLQTARVACP